RRPRRRMTIEVPAVSIVTPCYNAGRFISRTVESVRRQTFAAWEHVVVDDGSTDDSAAVVTSLLASEPRLRLIRQANGGMSDARNNGFRACSPSSRYLLFLDADDCLEPGMLETLYRHLELHPEAGMAYCDHVHIDEQDRVISRP